MPVIFYPIGTSCLFEKNDNTVYFHIFIVLRPPFRDRLA